jgi:hypothetical protein
MTSPLEIVSIVIVVITTLTILWGPRGRWVIAALALQYAGVFILVSQIWPLSLAAVKLITGWMAGAVLGASQPGTHTEQYSLSFAARLFRIMGGAFVLVVVFSIALAPQDWLPIGQAHLVGGLILIGMGMFQLGLASKPLSVIVGLLTALSGFEVIYAAVVPSVLVAGLLAVVSLGLALAGAYWMVPVSEEEEA